jgi:hypothetical protein
LWLKPVTWSITRAAGWNIDLVLSRPTSRRALLVGAGAIGAALVVSSCGADSPGPVALESDPAAPTDVQSESELRLLALYAAVAQAFPDLGQALAPIADQHREHARELGQRTEASGASLQVPATRRQALRLLIDAEERATRERQDGCATESSPERVRVLTLIAASEASHVPELNRIAGSSS